MRVMIAEDSGLLREMIAEALERSGIEVTGQAETPDELLRLIAAAPPEVAILDIRLPPTYRDEGIQLARTIRAGYPGVGLLVLSHYAETSYAMRLLEHGAQGIGYLVKDRVRNIGRLREAVTRVAAGETVIDPEVVQQVMFRHRTTDPLAALTTVERQVLQLIAEGLSNAAVADRLGCSPKTVEKRVTAITQKLGLPADASRGEVNVRVLAVLTYLRSAGMPSG